MHAISVNKRHLIFCAIAIALAAVALQPPRAVPLPEVSVPEVIAMVDTNAPVIPEVAWDRPVVVVCCGPEAGGPPMAK